MNSAGNLPWCDVAMRTLPPRMAYATRPPITNRTTRQMSDVMNTVVNPTSRNQSQSVAKPASQGTTNSARNVRARMAMIRRRTSRRRGGTTRRPGPSNGRVMALVRWHEAAPDTNARPHSPDTLWTRPRPSRVIQALFPMDLAKESDMPRLQKLLGLSLLPAALVLAAAGWTHDRHPAPRHAPPVAPPVDTAVLDSFKWRNIGPERGGRSIAVSGVRGQPKVAYFGATGGGLWKTTDGGDHWAPVTDGQITSASVGAVAVSET